MRSTLDCARLDAAFCLSSIHESLVLARGASRTSRFSYRPRQKGGVEPPQSEGACGTGALGHVGWQERRSLSMSRIAKGTPSTRLGFT